MPILLIAKEDCLPINIPKASNISKLLSLSSDMERFTIYMKKVFVLMFINCKASRTPPYDKRSLEAIKVTTKEDLR